eukprot:423777-Pyramimonas_sp.AAC.1
MFLFELALLTRFSVSGRTSCAALQVWECMRANGIAPNAIAYSALISACDKCGEWERAVQVTPRPFALHLRHTRAPPRYTCVTLPPLRVTLASP